MKTYIGLWDYLFGKWGEIEIPMADGTTKKVPATTKWIKSLEAAGKIERLGPPFVKVHVLDLFSDTARDIEAFLAGADPDDLLAGMSANRPRPKVEYWEIGKQISKEQFDKLKDPVTEELFVLVHNNSGRKQLIFGNRQRWETAVKKWESSA